MAAGDYQYQSEFAKTHQAKGRAEGRVLGRAEGHARGVLNVLDARGLQVSEAQRARVLACVDLDTLDRWIRKAVTVASVDQLFED